MIVHAELFTERIEINVSNIHCYIWCDGAYVHYLHLPLIDDDRRHVTDDEKNKN